MPQAQFFDQILIKIGSGNAPEEFYNIIDEVVVDLSLSLPSMFTIKLNDHDFEWVDDSRLDLGTPVEISVETPREGGSLSGLLMRGEITALEPSFGDAGGSALLVRGYDKSHRLHRGKKTRTFLKQKDDAVVQKIAGEAGLSPEIDATKVTYDYILQNNQTNMEFLQERAARIGYQVYSAEGKLFFKKGDATLGDGPTLSLAESLRSFRASLHATGQSDQITVKGWDEKGKQPITANASPSGALNQGGMKKTGADAAKDAFGAAEAVVTDAPVFTPDEAQGLATGLSNDVAREYLSGEGVAHGDPRIKAGWTVTIEGVGTRFKGKYFVTSAMHIMSGGGYETVFSISGRQPNTLSQLLDSGNGHHGNSGTVSGVVSGLVTNLNDPDNLGRVKVKYAWLGEIESDWVRIATPMSGAERGFFYLPEVNDEVLLAFSHGDVHHPYIVGHLWNSKDKPPKPNSQVVGGGKVNERVFKSRSGHLFIFDDTDGKEQIILRDKTDNNEMVIDSKKNSMTIKVNGDFTVEAKGKITLKSTQDMVLDSSANGNFKTKGNMGLDATGNLNAEAKLNTTVTGLQLTLEGKTKATLKGLTVSVNGTTLTEVKGALVKIN